MRKVNYPSDLRKFKKEFLKEIPELANKAANWMTLWQATPILQRLFPKRIHQILLADYRKLIVYYLHYVKIVRSALPTQDFKTLDEQLADIFDYTKAQPRLADFFMKNANQLKLSVCHYCEAAYINAYATSDELILKRLNKDSKLKLMHLLGIKNRTAQKIIDNRPFPSSTKFNEFWKDKVYKNTEDKFSSIRYFGNHFDLDHVLDKGSCPIVGLSLMNLVPSCQVCNEKIKKSKILGDPIREIPLEKLSPTSPLFDFDTMVKIELKSNGKRKRFLDPAFALADRDFYDVEFNCIDPDYSNFVETFKLEERYQFHKAEGLYWLQTKRKYTDTTIAMMARALGSGAYSFFNLKEDIFRIEYDRIRKPCFDKMKRDVLK